MKANCAHHLIDELKLLKPHLTVFHAVDARWVVRPALEDAGLELTPADSTPDNHGPVLYEVKGLGTHFLFLLHPSHGWLDRQWDAVVEPNLDYLRSKSVIPM